MSYERSISLLLEAYERDHGQLVQVMGDPATIAAIYRNDIPRQCEHVGKQEELYAMLLAILEFARE